MINQITTILLPDGQVAALTDWSARPLYSTVDMLSGFDDEELRLFSYSEGGQVVTTNNNVANAREASLRDTNVESPSEMDSTQEYLVYALSVECHQFTSEAGALIIDTAGQPIPRAVNLALLANRIVLELEASDKAFPQAGLAWFSAGFGVALALTSTAGPISYGNYGTPSIDAVDYLPIPVHLGGTEDYSVILHNPPNGPADGGGAGTVTFITDAAADADDAVIVARVYFRGLQKRAVG
jgi:hypothetical protein